jgi:Fe-S-cluster containining protein
VEANTVKPATAAKGQTEEKIWNNRKAIYVPCGSCSACCYGHQVPIKPEQGDNIMDYIGGIVRAKDPNNPWTWILARKESGACHYLEEQTGKCTIYDKRPVVCRTFDCRDGNGKTYAVIEAGKKLNMSINDISKV